MSSFVEVGRPDGTHPFFRNIPAPDRAFTPTEGDLADDEVEILKGKGLDSDLKNQPPRGGPLSERPSNIQEPPVASEGMDGDSTSSGQPVSEDPMRIMRIEPKQKMLKVNHNGKLLSSPPPVTASPCKVKKTPPTKSPRKTRTSTRKAVTKTLESRTSLIVKLAYGLENTERRSELGGKIDQIVKGRRTEAAKIATTPPLRTLPRKSTHPFFLGSSKPVDKSLDLKEKSGNMELRPAGINTEKMAHRPSPKKATAWKDIVFSQTTKAHLSLDTATPWPPRGALRVDDLDVQAVNLVCSRSEAVKSKSRSLPIPPEEDVLLRARNQYRRVIGSRESQHTESLRLPLKRILTGGQFSSDLDDQLKDTVQPATQTLKESLSTTLSAFDQGTCEQSSWDIKRAPTAAVDVLQAGPEAVILRDWVRQLTVNSVGEGLESRLREPKTKKRKRVKTADDIDDFIVCSDDEDKELLGIYPPIPEDPFIPPIKRTLLRHSSSNRSSHNLPPSNVILLSGPSGCGKTASVYAVAKELGFEVFELNPGSRRNHRDLFDKVGDMAQNHLVQSNSAENSAAEDTAGKIDESDVQRDIASGKQGTMKSFFKLQPKTQLKIDQKRKAALQDDQRNTAVKKPKRAQKQSLILLEEVDVLFDDDKTFWNGVHALIDQSRRPIILTCNDESALPLDELPFHGILRYSPPPEDVAVNHMLTLAAHEGHQLDRNAVTSLHRSRKQDLRASLSELNFWCQMGVGSRKGGLDWMLERRNAPDASPQRVISTNTYLTGMNLTPQDPDCDPEQLMLYAERGLGIPTDTWCYDDTLPFSPLMTLADTTSLISSQSDLDLCRPQSHHDTDPTNLQLRIATALTTRMVSSPPSASTITDILTSSTPIPSSPQPFFTPPILHQILAPLAIEKPVFPPAIRRPAPTLDAPLRTLTTDVVPYVRAIVAHDQRWGGSANANALQQRETRARRKAGGWFSARLDGDAILRTAGRGWGTIVEQMRGADEPRGVEMEIEGAEEVGDTRNVVEI